MKFLKKTFLFSIAIFFPLYLISCRDMLSDMDAICAPIEKMQSLKMVSITDVTNNGTTGISPYRINTYETTYLLWYENLQWAKEKGFIFIKDAQAGKSGITGEPGVYGYLPVTSFHPGRCSGVVKCAFCKKRI